MPVFMLRTAVGFVTYSTDQIRQYHFRVTLFAVLARIILGKPLPEETPEK